MVGVLAALADCEEVVALIGGPLADEAAELASAFAMLVNSVRRFRDAAGSLIALLPASSAGGRGAWSARHCLRR